MAFCYRLANPSSALTMQRHALAARRIQAVQRSRVSRLSHLLDWLTRDKVLPLAGLQTSRAAQGPSMSQKKSGLAVLAPRVVSKYLV